ncbi:xylulokinase [Boudabousia tangfeifanii]|uniref:Xylulose kinase n=1 Tax=Boudabousia tangfeifanii TaxID=1912795 RepID=A0A1D9MJE8_9ACTO|nr:xylulokinase [Boudabousia tangfeifanii]AOZ72412.1 xylulokinase [Boudabousia tangfeifanii]
MAKRVVGVDSSTQSCKVLVVDAENGTIIRSANATHPKGTEVDPAEWLKALEKSLEAVGGIDDCHALAIGGQQHGMVCLDYSGQVIRPALLWNDTRSAQAANDLVNELGAGDDQAGADAFVQATGSIPVPSFTITKLRWLADNEPENAKKIAAICLPHDWLTWQLQGAKSLADLVTDRSDASGTGYFDSATNEYRYDLLALALRISEDEAKKIQLPKVLGPNDEAGKVCDKYTRAEIVLGPGCGDNAAAALGLGLEPLQASISLGTSGVICAVFEEPLNRHEGLMAGFADATGNWLALTCTLNCAQILDYTRELLQVDYQEFDRLVSQAELGANGLGLTPFYAGERTPNLPSATASWWGLNTENRKPENYARAALESLGYLLRYSLEVMAKTGNQISSALLIGGSAKSKALQEIFPNLLNCHLDLPTPGEYVALGAAKQAAWVLTSELPTWKLEVASLNAPANDDIYQESYGHWVKQAIG